MKDTELKVARDRDLFLAYQKALRNNVFQNQWEAVEFVRTHPAPRFYISSKVCSLLLGRVFAGKPVDGLHPLSRKRLKELERLYRDYEENAFKGKRMRERICEIIVDMPAPEFYVSNRYATRIINREMARHNGEKIRRMAR